ncbi:hypothetical protein [Oryzobacter telluris]|uniref:hypothetical protein n=1 Tax=Oryzobacter telluris TaxID=3149179 RepID=UPI00370D6127
MPHPPRIDPCRRAPGRVGRSARVLAVALLCLAAAPAAPASAQLPELAGTDVVRTATLSLTDFAITQAGTTYVVPYWSNGGLSRPDSAVRNVVVTVHGDSRNADDYGRYTADAATLAGRMSTTVVVAPWFAAAADSPRSNQLYWSADGWKQGDPSVATARAWTISSFAVLDAMAVQAHRSFPNARITVAGHSAGGQFVQRYVAFAGQDVVTRYLPMNPGTYLYLDTQRWSGTTRRALTPSEQRACPRWNTWKYGLSRRSGPLSTRTDTQARAAYAAAPVSYLLGGLDTVVDSSLDTGCSATWEGANRLARGRNFFAALPRTLGADAVRSHSLVTVPGVAHSGGSMIRSAEARPLLLP